MKNLRNFSSFLLLLSLFSAYANAQTSVQLVDSLSKTITPFFSNRAMLQIDTIHLKIKVLDSLVNADTLITFNLNASNFPNQPQLQNTSIVIPTAKRIKDSVIDTLLVLTTGRIPDSLRQDEFAALRIGNNNEFLTLRLSSKKSYDPQKPFWIELGANLDLIDGLRANNLFAGVFLYKRDIRSLCSRNNTDNLGIFAGVYESKAVTSRNDFPSTSFVYRTSDSFPPVSDSGYIFKDTGEVKVNQELRNVGLFISPQIRLSNGLSDGNGLHFFVGLWAEIQWQRITNNYDYTELRRLDTLNIALTDLEKYNPLKKSSSVDLYSHYEGIAFPIFFKWGDINLFFNAVVGTSNQFSSKQLALNDDLLLLNDIPRYWRGFYAMQFRLNEEHYGLAMSGEVRGLLIKNNKPIITLVLSKKFDLNKLLEFN
jgi:hypothetical protein